jgi:hypothetical protein
MTGLIDIVKPSPWQMTFGERAALEGILSQLTPSLAVEIGTAEGGSLRRIAQHSEEVHSFDLVTPDSSIQELENVTLHTGDSHVLLPEFLERLAAEGRNVDFVLVDGDHSADGVERDIRDLLGADALKRTVILAHDTLNDEVREGINRVDFNAEPKVIHADLDFVGGHLSQGGPFHHQLWGGLGLVLIDAVDGPLSSNAEDGHRFYDLFELIAPIRDTLVSGESATANQQDVSERDAELRVELMQANEMLDAMRSSLSWRITAPLRTVKASLGRRK